MDTGLFEKQSWDKLFRNYSLGVTLLLLSALLSFFVGIKISRILMIGTFTLATAELSLVIFIALKRKTFNRLFIRLLLIAIALTLTSGYISLAIIKTVTLLKLVILFSGLCLMFLTILWIISATDKAIVSGKENPIRRKLLSRIKEKESFLPLMALLIIGPEQNTFPRMSELRKWILFFCILFEFGLIGFFSVIVANQLSPASNSTAFVLYILGMFFAIMPIGIIKSLLQIETKEKTAIYAELQAAHDMQMGLMPKEDPKIEGFDISGICLPANEVGGDFFDYVWLNDAKNLLGIAVADVSGKAMKAAITAVMTSGMVYREVGMNETPKNILKKINRPMYLKTDRRVFTALSFAVIDIRKKELTFSNAGQMTPLLRRGDTLRSIKVEGPRLPLGVQEVVDYNEVIVQLQSGDILILFTDGIVEAKNSKEELWGFERMEEAVKNLSLTITAKEMGEALVAAANKFAGTAKQNDDMTVVVVRIL